MCGIFGLVASEQATLSGRQANAIMDDLFRLSESRGKEASGVAFLTPETITVAKHAVAASDLIGRREYRTMFGQAFKPMHGLFGNNRPNGSVGIIGHSRLVTNGGQQVHENNQPVITSGIVGIHNGIITNVDELWARHPDLDRSFDIDTEILLSLIRKYQAEEGSLVTAVQRAFADIEGAANIAVFFSDLNCFLLATNNGSLYLTNDSGPEAYVFASERFILNKLSKKRHLRELIPDIIIRHVYAGSALLIDLTDMHGEWFELAGASKDDRVPQSLDRPRRVLDVSSAIALSQRPDRILGEGPYVLPSSFEDAYPRSRDAIASLRRCTRCILPETMPFITFDAEGVCNYCHDYRPQQLLGLDALKRLVAPLRRNDGEPDCLVTFSGGRDSSYGVHFMKTELGMNPITYTYDWGMVTDLARRNQMRICGQLGIEHILVSADIKMKRDNIRRNVSAWLRQPDVGTIPLFMAGDKLYFYWANRISQQIDCRAIVMCENLLETTRFKSGFCGVAPRHDSERTYSLTATDKLKMIAYYGKSYLTNPAYLNRSMIDTVIAFWSYYLISQEYLFLFNYIPWDEESISNTLIDEYNWETASDTESTWRIGDGTAAFYNYIYYTMAGLTENDTFRSNQIREGVIDRAEAMRLALRDNQPRYDSMQWYCDVINIDFHEAVRTINRAPKLYSH